MTPLEALRTMVPAGQGLRIPWSPSCSAMVNQHKLSRAERTLHETRWEELPLLAYTDLPRCGRYADCQRCALKTMAQCLLGKDPELFVY